MNQYTNKQKRIRAVALVMALVMVVTGIPLVPGTQGTVEAATGNIQPNYPNGTVGSQEGTPLTAHNKLFTLDGMYYSITDPQAMRYTVEQVSTGQSYESSTSPVIDPGNRFRFVDIDLFVGLNKITINHQSGTVRSYANMYVYYNDTPVVADLKMQNTAIDSDENIVTVTLGSGQTVAQIDLSGIAYNTSELIIRNKTLLGSETNAEQSVQINAFSNDFFTIIPLKAGVNDLEFVAKNVQGRTQTLTRKVVLNIVTGLGLSVMNIQSNYKTAAAENRNHLPENGQVDISQQGGASNLTNPALVTGLPNGHILFSGRVLLNGTNMLPFDQTVQITDGTGTTVNLSNTLELDIVDKDGVSILTSGAVDLRTVLTQKINTTGTTVASLVDTQNGVPYVDFAIAVPEGNFDGPSAWKYGKYSIVLKPAIYKSNPANTTDYALNTDLKYNFDFVNHTLPQFSGVSIVSNGEYIMEHNQPYPVSQESLELYLHHKNIASGNISVRVYQAPYETPANVGQIDESKGIPATSVTAAGADRSLVKLDNLPPGNVLVVAYVGKTAPNPENQAMITKRLLIAKGPAVTLKDGDSKFVTANKEYIWNQKTSGQTKEDFLEKYFKAMKLEVSSYSDPNLGMAANPITIEVNSAPPISHTSKAAAGTGVIEIPLDLIATNWLQSENQLNRIVVTFKDGNITSRTEFTFLVITEGAPVIQEFKTRFEGVVGPFTSRKFGEIVETDKDLISVEGGAENFEKATLFINGEILAIAEKDTTPGTFQVTKFVGNANFPYTINNLDYVVDTNGKLTFTITDLSMDNEKSESIIDQFHVSLEVQNGTTIISEKIVIMPLREIFTVLTPFRQVVNNNLQPIIIKAPTASAVKIGKIDAQKVSRKDESTNHMSKYVMNYLRDRLYGDNKINEDKLGDFVFYAEVPLKTGENKLKLTITVGDKTYPGEIVLFYAGTLSEGAVYQTDLKKNKISPKELGGAISLSFPKNTLLQPKSSIMEGATIPYELPDFWYDKSLLIGVANKYTGKVDRDISRSNPQLRQMLVGSPNALDYYHYASELFYIDAGTLQNPGGRLPFEGDMVTRRVERDVLTTNNRGTLTLKYDQSVVQDASLHMTVMYHPGYQVDGQAQWQNIGGIVDAKNNTITVPFDEFGYYVVMKLRRSFNDVINHGWARRNMEAVFSKGIMANETPERFGPDRPITRGEFATLLVKALAIELNDGPYSSEGIVKSPTRPTFDDVRPNMGLPYWDYKYIETAARAGIVQGKYPRRFVPNEFLTREQAAVMIARALEAKLARTPEQALTQLTKEFTDAPSIEYYALQSVAAISKTGIVVGKQNDPNDVSKGYSFLPKNTLTRAEASVIATRLMQYKKLLPDPL